MATLAELDALARSLPAVEARLSGVDQPQYRVKDKLFLAFREPRKDAIDSETGAPMDDVIYFRVPDLARKDERLAEADLPLFTTPHFDGWPGVLIRARDLGQVDADALRSLVVEAWLTQAPKRLAREWLAQQGQGTGA